MIWTNRIFIANVCFIGEFIVQKGEKNENHLISRMFIFLDCGWLGTLQLFEMFTCIIIGAKSRHIIPFINGDMN